MARHQPFQIVGYHSCDKEVGLKVLNGSEELNPSNNNYDWLAGGVYFWEQNPLRALHYAVEVAEKTQYAKGSIKTPFVLGAIIQLGNCLNLVESESIGVLKTAYSGLVKLHESIDRPLPVNTDNNRKLDCAVLRMVHESAKEAGKPFDTVRCSFDEGEEAYPGANFTNRHHIQVCVINPEMIKGYFLPRPISEFNPYLGKSFTVTAKTV